MESAYDRKFEEMKKYIPFLESMIKRLESTSSASSNPRQAQLDKIRSLRDLLLDKKKRMKMENLLKCEQVLVNLYAKVEQRDAFPDVKQTSDMKSAKSKEKTDLEIVRNKLKTVAKIQADAETLPEIARANDIELHYTGSKEPALFQRRPNRSSKSPARTAQKNPNESKTNSPQSQHRRNYTRVLVSPNQSPRRWLNSEQSSSDQPLFSRRSPPRTHSPSSTKKEKKKSKMSKSRKTKDLNITLNVPEESLNSLNTKDILSRIINCSDGDVDIDTLRELRTQILGELKQTGKNDDISDLILKSYNKKTKSKTSIRRKKDDVEEGELSDSESEAIESIYGSLVVVDKDKKSSAQVESTNDKDSQQRKIQICLVINSDDNESKKGGDKFQQGIDFSEFEMLSENESDKSKEIILVDSDTPSSSPKKTNKQNSGHIKDEKKIDTSRLVYKISTEKNTECINVEDDNDDNEDNEVKKTQAVDVWNIEATNVQISNDNKESSGQIDALFKSRANEDAVKSSTKKDTQEILNNIDSGQKTNSEKMQEDLVQPPMFIANFYKPIGEEEQNISATISCAGSNNLPEKHSVPIDEKDLTLEKQYSPMKEIISTVKESPSAVKKSLSTEKDKDDLQKIPLLNEPTVPKGKTDVLSEIDILQALKNEILSDNIAVPGSETITPALHQPKLTKVASAQEVIPKKRISIEKYKEKTSTSTSKPLFIKKRNKTTRIHKSKKQSLKLTEKECERFNFPKRLSLDDDDDDDNDDDNVDDLSDDDFLIEDKDDSLDKDDIYGDLAPKSPENEIIDESSASPIIIPEDPVKVPVVSSRTDVDMRALLPIVSLQSQIVPQPVPPPMIPHVGFGAGIPPSPAYSFDMLVNETNMEQTKKVADITRVNSMDPRMRRDLNASVKNSPNPYAASNPERTPRSSSFSNVVPSAPSMTPSRTPIMTPNMTPSRTPIMTPSMTPSYLPSIPQLLTPNARSFEMTPSHQSFELEESGHKHVYAPSFSTCDNRERESSVLKDGPHWEINRNDPRSARRNRWEDLNVPISGTKWEDRMSNSRSNSGQTDAPLTPRYEDSYKPKYDKYNNRVRCEKYNIDRRDTYKPDCPATPIPSFGWSECPPTPGSAFGRQEAPMTPSHSFGRTECSSTPNHSFSRTDCPTTPINSFGRTDCPSIPGSAFGSHSFRSECPSTPSHSFGRSECPPTPSHSFGRGDCPQTPSHQFGRSEVIPFGRSDISNTSNNQKFTKDPRLNRRQTEYESSSASEKDRDYQSERGRKTSSYKPQSKHYGDLDVSRNYEREKSVGSNDRNNSSDRGVRQYDRDRREPSLSRSISKDADNDSLYTRNRESRYDGKKSKNYENLGSRLDQREKSDGQTSENKKQSVERARSTSRAVSVSRTFGKEPNKDQISCESDAGRNFTINTSIKSTFQDFLPNGKPIQVFDYSFDARKQRATSVGRSLVRENSVVRTLSTMPVTSENSTYNKNKNDKFERASSVGRDLLNTKDNKSFQEVKADFEAYRSNLKLNKIDTIKEMKKDKLNSRSRKDIHKTHPEQINDQSKQPYSPKKNYRDPRMRKELPVEHKSRYKIDRRGDSHDSKKSGIIYSNDNIAKGTIMGFGVKNYKIPKIKRVTVEQEEVAEEKTVSVEKRETKEKQKVKESENDKKNKPKHTNEIVKPVESLVKNKNESENNKISNIVHNSDRVTRSKNKTDTKQSKQSESVIKTRKSKRSVIYDSESDSGSEKEETKKHTKNPLKSPNKKVNISKKTISPVVEKEVQNKSSEGLLDSSFGIDDMEIFPESIGSDPVIENINALIADLDNDLESSKISNDSLATEMENMMESVNSPEGNSLGDISEVIEKDLNETNENLQQKNISNTTLQEVKLEGHSGDLNNQTLTDLAIEKPAAREVSLSGSNVTKPILNDTTLSKVNEAVVSTTEIVQNTNTHEDNVKKSTLENTAKDEEGSIPDSTINKKISDKTEVGVPDSTNEMHCELTSDKTSTYNALETSKNESVTQNSTHKETFNSIGSLLSMLQDKSKIKELLSMLGNQSSDNEKIKKKLEKLSEIVSDEEDENEVQKKVDDQKEVQLETNINEKSIVKTETMNKSHELDKQNDIDLKDRKQGSGVVPQMQHIEVKVQTDTVKENTTMKNIENNESKSSISEVENGTAKKSSTISDDIETGSLTPGNEKKNKEDIISEDKNRMSTEEADETNKLNDEECDDEDLDDEPLVKKVTNKRIVRNSKGKLKTAPNKKIPATGVVPSEVEVKKPVKEKKPSRELQKLQEDIKEMFMSDDILNTTGIRMCRLAKLVTENDNANSGPVVVLEKVKGLQNENQPPKLRKKPGPKPKIKAISKSTDRGTKSIKRAKSSEKESKMEKPKILPKHKPCPKSKMKQKSEEIDPYEFDADSVTDTNTTKGSDTDSSDSENESLASSRSFGSSEVLAETNKKTKRKRRGTRGWQSGIIKPKSKKKKEQKQEILNDDSPIVKLQRPMTIPDLNCFTDKEYCFQKGVTTYHCRLCVYSGTDIVNHYKKQHPHTEIPLSRMDPQTAEVAIQQCEEINIHAISKIPSEKYTCRFCRKEFGTNRTALETFFWHIVSNHTGEFKHLCSECVNVTRCPFNLDIPPPPKDGGQVIGYICGKCNFTQISLENLKKHVIMRHNDEQTEVFTTNLALMSKKAMKAMLRRTQAEQPRVLRSLRSNRSTADTSDCRDDRSDVTESSAQNSDYDPSQQRTEDHEEEEEQKPIPDQMKAKLTFENDDLSDETSVKMEQDADDRDESSHFEDTFNIKMAETNLPTEPPRGNSDDIMDYPHFKRNQTDSGAKEYVCCINGNDNHYKTSLLISMKKHIQSKHSEKWDGYCCLCKVIVTLQGVQSDFKDCLSHFLDKHIDDFPMLEKVVQSEKEESLPVPGLPIVVPVVPTTVSDLLTAIPARVATPPVERTASPSYIAVRPIAELISKELVKEIETLAEDETPIPFPKIENVVSLGEATVAPSLPSPVYPTTAEPASQPDKPFLYEDMQAEVMSKKHRVVLDGMMSKENLVRLFKCAGRFCSFTSDSPEDALLHASTHQRVGGEGALNCAYCNYDACENGIDLVMHVFKDHSRCQYCCPLCFYRASASQLVGVHYKKAHSGSSDLKNVLRSTATVASPTPAHSAGLLKREVAVQHFFCSHDDNACNFKTYTPGKFIEHLQQWHSTATSHPCNQCSSKLTSPSELVVHLRTHGLKLYQCTWCVYGANNEQELLTHAASCHPDRQPQAYVRVITNKDGNQRVLPLAYLNKSKVTTEDVIPNTTKENPVREAERSIELEKLIGHTLLMLEASMSQNPEDTKEETPTEEPVELPPDNLPEDHEHQEDEPSAVEPLLTPTEEHIIPDSNITSEAVSISAEKIDTPEKIQGEPPNPPVKCEPANVLKDLTDTEIICLDSDDDEAPNTTAEEAKEKANDDISKSNLTEEARTPRLSEELSRSSVTDEVSITKITDESALNSINSDDSRQNIIDLSDDEPLPVNTPSNPGTGPIVKNELYKCPKCHIICKSCHGLKKHVKKCFVVTNTPCPHKPCMAVITGVNKLVEHYLKVHVDATTKRLINFCGICNNPFHTIAGAKVHIKTVHKVQKYSVSITKDEQGTHRYIILDAGGQRTEPPRISARKTSTEIQRYTDLPSGRSKKTSTEIKKKYGIEDIDKLPISPILDTQVYCELCEFGTKVRLNMVRHLQLHAGSMPVPHTAPVNPVPHLETNEKHFDKMVNLASSSVVTRAADKPQRPEGEPSVSLMVPPAESSRYPKYVPERQRYTCGAKDCLYISVDMAMFRCHWETLHAGDEEYRCVHCPPHQSLDTSIPLTAARILAHLRMHDVSLYACSVCSYYHYRKHLVEKHLLEMHKDASVKVVREEYTLTPVTPPPIVGAPTMDLKAWQCGLCKFTSMLRPEVVIHCGNEHQSKMQFKCAYCPFRTSTKENVVKHQTNAHPTKAEEIFYYFYREGSIPNDADGVPRWQKQRQKLGLEEPEVKTEPEPLETVPEDQATLTPIATPVSIDLNLIKKEVTEEPTLGIELSMEDLCKKFGQFCEPDGIKYKCSLCNGVREHTREAMQCHLYEELNYRRWECVTCLYKAFHKTGLNEHMASEHSRQFTHPRALPIDVNIEKWVLKLLDHQTSIIEANIQNLAIQKVQGERASATPTSPRKAESPKLALSATDAELEAAFGEFGVSQNHQFSCPKCDFLAKDEADMVLHLESELNKIRWGCTNCTGRFQTFHEAQFHCKSAHTGQPARPKEAIRDPSLRTGWITAVVTNQRQFMKCISETGRETTPEKNTDDSEQNENSLLVARYDTPIHTEEQLAIPAKRAAPSADSDEERLVIDEPQKKKVKDRQCPYCDYNTPTARCLREHILKHYDIKPYKCWYCPFDGTRPHILNHQYKEHPHLCRRLTPIQVPNYLPKNITLKSSKCEVKEQDDVPKTVCLYCEKSVPESETESHVHGYEKSEFAKRGEVVVKCCNCLVLRLTLTSLQEHFDTCHPSERLNYAYFKLQIDTREIHCCGHCYKKFKFLRDLKAHHAAIHTFLSLSYTSIPFSHNLHTEGDSETNKRKIEEDTAGPPMKRVARKSTSKLPNSAVAKKSTTKLPFSEPELEEYSYYGAKPLHLDNYAGVTLKMPMYNTTVEVNVKKLSEVLKINPKVVLKKYTS